MDAPLRLDVAHAARLLGVRPTDLHAVLPGVRQLDADTMDLLTNQPPTWLLEARARTLVEGIFTEVSDDLLAAGLERTGAVASALATSVLTNDEVSELLDLPSSVVAAFEPRRGWTADAVADLLRQQPSWMRSADAAKEAARKATWRAARAEERRAYAATAKVRTKERNRARWAEIAGVALDEVPASFTKAVTPDAIERFWKRPPAWAPATPPAAA